MAVVVLACSSFGTEGGEAPASAPDASADVVSSSSSSGGDASSGGARPDAGPFTCPSVTFCDDFTRAETSDVKGPWTTLKLGNGDREPVIENGVLHLFVAATTDDGARTYLVRELPSCVGKKITVDVDFELGTVARETNLAVITLNDGDKDHFVSLGIVGSAIQLGTSNADGGTTYVLHGSVDAPPPGQWTHARIIVDAKQTPTVVSAVIGAKTIGPSDGEEISTISSCRFAIGNDFARAGPATERWFDDVTADVAPAP